MRTFAMVARAIVALSSLVIALHGPAQAAAPPISADCARDLAGASVTEAFKFIPDQLNERVKEVSIGDVIELRITGLEALLKSCVNMPIVLFVNGYSIDGLKPGPLVIPNTGALRFTLRAAEGARQSWVPILGYPSFKPRDVVQSIGVEGQYPVQTVAANTTLKLTTIGNFWFATWSALFVIMVGVFYWCVRHTNIIRDGNPTTAAAGVQGAYSLSKSQGALWFFVILASYLLIGLVTGDFVNSINSTALILLGIGAGTVIGSAVIDAAKEADSNAKRVQDVTEVREKLATLEQELAAIATQLQSATLTPEQRAALEKQRADKLDAQQKARFAHEKLTGQNQQFLQDILSDANGVSFHRFQMAAWTLVLAIVFVKGVFENLSMPIFDTTLMGLLGLSAGTYLGLKIPEATTPKKDRA